MNCASKSMRILCEPFSCSKDGASESENDDAYQVPKAEHFCGDCFRCAVADGATESLFAGKWAALIARAYFRGRFAEGRMNKWVSLLQDYWTGFLRTRPLPWYAEAKAEKGSFSTLLGLEIQSGCKRSNRKPRWTATAVGDSCLFLVRDGILIRSFPIDDADAFNNQPHLLSSNPRYNAQLAKCLLSDSGDVMAGDEFYLLTDALSAWFLALHRNGGIPWQILNGFSPLSSPNFDQWIANCREQDDYMNDDATMLRIKVESLE